MLISTLPDLVGAVVQLIQSLAGPGGWLRARWLKLIHTQDGDNVDRLVRHPEKVAEMGSGSCLGEAVVLQSNLAGEH